MKKFLKIAGIVFVCILLWYIGMTILFTLLWGKENKKNEIIRTEENVTEEKINASINISGDVSSGSKESTNEYYDTMQEALLNSKINLESEEQYRRNVDEIIKKFESDEYSLLIYCSVKDKREEAYNEVRFNIRLKNGKKQYRFEAMRGRTAKYNSLYLDTAKEVIENGLIGSEIIGSMGVNPTKERFMYGSICEDFFEEGESIYNLEIEGQKPDEIIEYESFGKTWYFWYYNDLKSDKPYNELEFTLKK